MQCFFKNYTESHKETHLSKAESALNSCIGTTFPGDHVENGEIFTESVIREVREETGLLIENSIFCGVYHWIKSGVHNVIFLYKANQFPGTLHDSEEGCVYWIPLEEFKEKELATGMEYVLQIMESSRVLVKKQVRCYNVK